MTIEKVKIQIMEDFVNLEIPLNDPQLSQPIIAFTRWYILTCLRQEVKVDGVAYDLSDAYSDWIEGMRN